MSFDSWWFDSWWFDSWAPALRTVVVGSLSYLTLIVLLRISGKRTLAKLNAFDLVVTVAVGSTLATILLSSSVSFTQGAAALGLLAGLQMIAALLSSRRRWGRRVLTSPPTVLLRDGKLLPEVLSRQRLSDADIRQAVRGSGHGDLGAIGAVVLESDGSLSVIPVNDMGDGSALVDTDPAGAP